MIVLMTFRHKILHRAISASNRLQLTKKELNHVNKAGKS